MYLVTHQTHSFKRNENTGYLVVAGIWGWLVTVLFHSAPVLPHAQGNEGIVVAPELRMSQPGWEDKLLPTKRRLFDNVGDSWEMRLIAPGVSLERTDAILEEN